ncbi:MAG: hypothetical protein QOD38_1848 [Acidimicrobiaceae bacterium]|jgi:phage replication-related protein YjqB (UPF0714/DUF867 family)
MFAELLAHEGVEEVCELRSPFGLMAFHGGNLEQGTDQIATAAAEAAGASLYAVLQPRGLRWHVPSTAIRPAESERLAAFIDHVDVAVAVHGYGAEGFWTTLLLGGRNRELATHVGAALRVELTPHGYDVIDDLERVPSRLRGVHRDNPVNLPRGGGVQLELPPRVRGTSPMSKPEYTEALIAGLAAAASTWPVTAPDE